MKAPWVLPTLVLLPMSAHADCLERSSGFFGNPHALPATLEADERRRVESLIGAQAPRIACADITLGLGIDTDNGAIGATSRGYVALTDKALVFIGVKDGFLLPRKNYEILLDIPGAELRHIAVPSRYIGPNVMIDIGTSATAALVEVPRGSSGDAIVTELRARILQACGEGAYLTPTEVRCR